MAGTEFGRILSASQRDPADINSCCLVSLLRSFGSKDLRVEIRAACLKDHRMELKNIHLFSNLKLHTSRFGREHDGN
jgi:hypothetical protein